MRRRGQPQSGAAGVSLFPFLAVLLCTMGALIVVLVVIARQARLQLAEDDGTGAPSPLRQELEAKQADLQWRIEVLSESRSKTRSQLEAQRAELSHLEDHARRLQNQLQELDGARRQFDQLAAGGELEGDRLRREIEDIEKKIADKQKELERAIKKAGNGGDSYAVVAYHGPNETRRRPIYIECRRDGVIFQPEGLVLTERDFEGNLGPSSPMSCALRAAREHLARNQLPGEEGTPYPLLLVRPDGIVAYQVAHDTLAESGAEFGYELIGQDWPLEFPPTDPRLKLAMRQAIGEGRLRQAYLARAAPQLRDSGPHATFRASPRGGLMRDDGQPLGGDSRAGMRGRKGGRPSWAHGGQGHDDRYAGAGTGGGGPAEEQTKSSKTRDANPYRAALASQSQPASRAAGAGGQGASDRASGGSGTTAGTGAGGGGLLGVGAGDFAAGQLNAAPGSPTGVLVRAGNPTGTANGGARGAGEATLGSGNGPSAAPSGNLLDGAGAGNQLGKTGGAGAPGRNGKPGGVAGVGGRPGGNGRGWGAGQDKVAAVAAGLGGSQGLGSGGDGPAGNGSPPGAGRAGGNGTTAGGPTGKNAGGGAPKENGPMQGGPNGGGPDLQPASQLASASSASGAKDGSLGAAGGPGGTGNSALGNAATETSTGGGSTKGSAAGGSAKSSASASGSRSAAASKGGGSRGQSSASGSASAGGGGGGSGAAGQPQQPMVGVPGIPNMSLGQQQQSIASKRGEKNWANPAANRSSFPVTRPVKIVCDADHLTLLPEGRSRRGFKVIEFGEHSEDAVQELATAVWDRIDTWGAAGQGMYWRPELIMEVEPGGEQRFKELKALLADSGLDVRGRPRQGPAIKYPRTKTPN